MKIGTALYSFSSLSFTWSISFSGGAVPGQPYHLNCVFLLSPLRPETRPPEDMEKLYSPSSERLDGDGKTVGDEQEAALRLDRVLVCVHYIFCFGYCQCMFAYGCHNAKDRLIDMCYLSKSANSGRNSGALLLEQACHCFQSWWRSRL